MTCDSTAIYDYCAAEMRAKAKAWARTNATPAPVMVPQTMPKPKPVRVAPPSTGLPVIKLIDLGD